MTFFGAEPEREYVFWMVSFCSTPAAKSGRHARSNPVAIDNRFCIIALRLLGRDSSPAASVHAGLFGAGPGGPAQTWRSASRYCNCDNPQRAFSLTFLS